MRHEAHELAQPEDAREHLQDVHQHDGGEEVLDAVFRHEADYDDGERTGGARDHAGPAANQRGDQAHEEGSVEANQRVDPGDERESHCFGNEG